MASSLDYGTLDKVTAPVQFAADAGEKPVTVVGEVGSGPDERSGSREQRDVEIHDGRPIVDQLDLDREGYIFMRYPTAVGDFYDDDEVRRVYYPEMDRLVKDVTGASKVVVFDHTIRVDDGDTQQTRKVRSPVRGAHNDFTIASAEQRVRDLLPAEEAEARLGKRFGSINIWRPIREPVETAPLAICEWGTIEEKDLVAAERRYQDRIGGVYHLVHNPNQRWCYFSDMTREEILLLKCYDSLTDGTARWTAHGAFDDPATPGDAAPRESIEIRTLLFFD